MYKRQGSLLTHFHLIAVAYSSWLFIATLVVILIWAAVALLDRVGGGARSFPILVILIDLALPFYAFALPLQALQVAHRLSASRLLLTMMVLLVVAGGITLALGVSPVRLLERLMEILVYVVFPTFMTGATL